MSSNFPISSIALRGVHTILHSALMSHININPRRDKSVRKSFLRRRRHQLNLTAIGYANRTPQDWCLIPLLSRRNRHAPALCMLWITKISGGQGDRERRWWHAALVWVENTVSAAKATAMRLNVYFIIHPTVSQMRSSSSRDVDVGCCNWTHWRCCCNCCEARWLSG